MKYVVLVSHGMLAPGLHDALKMLAGPDHEDILSTSLQNGMGVPEFADNFRSLICGITEEDEILLFADLVGGSPLTAAADVIAERGLLDRTVMIGGMNMPLVLSAVIMKDNMDTADLIESLIPESRDELKKFKIAACEDAEDDI
jgi:PTS system N-acetylgalactosamine-specific IIA component